MAEKKKFSRRKFVVRSAVGVGVLFGAGYLSRSLWRRYLAGMINTFEPSYMGSKDPTLWFEVLADNKIKLHCTKVEMGQGSLTGLAQMAADELEIDMNNIEVVHAETSSGSVDQFATGGSTSISSLWNPMREMAATMREMLRLRGAELLNVDSDSAGVVNGAVTAAGKSISYGEIAAQTNEWTIPKTPELKSRDQFRYIGQPIARVDLRDKVLGNPIFGLDAVMPDMLFGAIAKPDKIGATFEGADISKAEQMPGVVKIVLEDDFVGVIAESRMEAEMAKNAISIQWSTDRNWTSEELERVLEVGKGKPVVIQKEGSSKKVLKGDQVITAEYKSPIGAHAQMEPNGALADVKGDSATVILSTQVVAITRREVAKRLGLKPKQVNIKPAFLGGGFGGRLHTPHAAQAAVMSKAVGRPVQCIFNRKEEFQNDTFRPPTHHVLKAKLDENGNIEAMEHNVSSGAVAFGSPMLPAVSEPLLGADLGAWRGGMIQYRGIPNYQAISWKIELPFATSWWRSLGLLANTFAIESFIDELAIKAGKNPIDFRLAHTPDDTRGKRLKEVMKIAAERGNYTDKVINGRAMGFAASTDANTPCAHVVDLSIDKGSIRIHKVTCVMDPGLVVNPDQVRAQCEGSVCMGISAAVYEQMKVENGSLQPTIYGPYRMALLKDTPKEIDVVLLENADRPGAVGEPPLGPIGAAIANALFRLTNKRLRSMPLHDALQNV